jgi:hypothetical protein
VTPDVCALPDPSCPSGARGAYSRACVGDRTLPICEAPPAHAADASGVVSDEDCDIEPGDVLTVFSPVDEIRSKPSAPNPMCNLADLKERLLPPSAPNHTVLAVTGGNWADVDIIEAAEGGVAIHGLGAEAEGLVLEGDVTVGFAFRKRGWIATCHARGHLEQVVAVYARKPGYVSGERAVANAKSHLGAPYQLVVGDGVVHSYGFPFSGCSDFSRRSGWGNHGIYCSELAWLAYEGETSTDACGDGACRSATCENREPGASAPGLLRSKFAGVEVRAYSTARVPEDFTLKCLARGDMLDGATGRPNRGYLKRVAR